MKEESLEKDMPEDTKEGTRRKNRREHCSMDWIDDGRDE